MSNDKSICEREGHDFKHLRSGKQVINHGYLNTYRVTDTFFCRRCLIRKETVQEEDGRGAPLWWPRD